MDPERDDYAEPGSAQSKPSPLLDAAIGFLSFLAVILAEFFTIELVQRLGR
jgi:hypothetical protein